MNAVLKHMILTVIILVLFQTQSYSSAFSHTSLQQQHAPCRASPANESILAITAAEEIVNNTAISNLPTDFQLYLRFSPLVGGPSFLLLNVEVILVPENECINIQTKNIEDVIKNEPNNYCDIHRFDFLPENPRDGATIAKLLQMQAVPGNVRYRPCLAEQNVAGDLIAPREMGDNTRLSENTESLPSLEKPIDERGTAILFGVGSSSSRNNRDSQSVLTTAINFVNKYRQSDGKELRILGGKNCLSFALDLLFNLDEMHGIDLKLTLPRLS